MTMEGNFQEALKKLVGSVKCDNKAGNDNFSHKGMIR